MENLTTSYSNLNCSNQNKVTENLELCNENLLNNSIFISGLCDVSTINLSNNMWKQETLDSYISVLNSEAEIKQVDSINVRIEILDKKVIEVPTYNNTVIGNYEGKKTTGRKLTIQGLLCLTVNYIENSSEQPVNSFVGNIPFSSYIILPRQLNNNEDTLNLKFAVSSCIEEVHINSIRGNNIYLSTTFTLVADKVDNLCDDSNMDCSNSSSASCSSFDSPNILGVCPIEKIRNLFSTFTNPASSSKYWNEISIPEVLTISESKPSIDQVLSLAADIEILCKKVIKTPTVTGTKTNLENRMLLGKKLIIDAILHQRVTYISKDDSNSIYSCNFNVPISTYIIIPNETLPTAKFEIIPCIEDIYTCVLNDRQIFKGINIFFKASPVNCANVIV